MASVKRSRFFSQKHAFPQEYLVVFWGMDSRAAKRYNGNRNCRSWNSVAHIMKNPVKIRPESTPRTQADHDKSYKGGKDIPWLHTIYMATIQFDREEVLQAIDAVARQTMNMDMPWDWPCGVAYYGLCEAAPATGREEYLQLMKERVDEYIELGLPAGP